MGPQRLVVLYKLCSVRPQRKEGSSSSLMVALVKAWVDCRENRNQDHHQNKKCKKAKWLSEEALQIAVKREAKSKGEKERYTHLNAEFQRIARRDGKAFLSDQCKEIEENNRMGKIRDLFKKIRDTKGIFHAKMGSIKDRNSRDLTESEDIKKRWQKYTEELYKKDLHDPDNHDGVITPTHLEPDILECEVKWASGSITMNKASGGDGIPVKLFQILKDDAVKVLHSICQQIWKIQQWPQDWKSQFSLQCQRMLKVLVTQSCPTPCDSMDCSPPGSSVHEIFQARILEWVAIYFSRGSSQPRDQTWVSCTAGIFFTIQGKPKNPQTTSQFYSSHSLVK